MKRRESFTSRIRKVPLGQIFIQKKSETLLRRRPRHKPKSL
nr:MAG TPA: hypothetical protein [Caudoviricetes sp.]